MTIAVCIRCGTMKAGVLIPCPECRFDPREMEDKGKALMLTDQFLSEEDLRDVSERLKNGQPVDYPQEAIDDYIRVMEEDPDVGSVSLFVKVAGLLAVLGVIACIIWLIVRKL